MEELWFKFKLLVVKLTYLQKRNRLRRYGFVIVAIALIFPLFIFIPEEYFDLVNSQTVSFLVFILIVTASSWYGGLGPGVLATLITSVTNYFTLLKADFPHHSDTGDALISLIYIIVGFLISIISEARYQAEFQKDEFIALVAHEIKNPLNTIKGYVGLLNQKLKKNGKNGVLKYKKKIFEYLEEVDIQADKLLELINDLLDVTKIEIGKFAYRDEMFVFDDLIKNIVSNQQVVNRKREIILTGSSKKIIRGDRYRIGQVITNLLTNAIKYSPQKSPVKIKVKDGKDKVALAVQDYGIGVPRSEQKAIFKHFYRSRLTNQIKAEGLGLGLFISSQIAKHHHGKLYVKSNGIKGSTFCLEVPKNY